MGAYMCSKCETPLTYYSASGAAAGHSCRIHDWKFENYEKVCGDCRVRMSNSRWANCRHRFKFVWKCYIPGD